MFTTSTYDDALGTARDGMKAVADHLPLDRVTDVDWSDIDVSDLGDLVESISDTVGETVVVAADTGRRLGTRTTRVVTRTVRRNPKVSGLVLLALISCGVFLVVRRRRAATQDDARGLELAGAA